MSVRTILHCDLNNFFASIECLSNPAIRDKPVAVCGSQELRHGIVLAKNEYAKAYGIKTTETIWQAKQKCPQLVIVPPNMHLYFKFSKMAREIYGRYTDRIEAFGVDECWLDVSGSEKVFGSGEVIAEKIRLAIKEELGITVSIGVSFNKIFAKLGSDIKKPDAITVISEENYRNTVWPLAVESLLYVGRATKRKLGNIAIDTIGDLARTDVRLIEKMFGKCGLMLYDFANGKDCSQVAHSDFRREIKSVGNSITTGRDLLTKEDVRVTVWVLAESVAERMRTHNVSGRTVEISLRDCELQTFSRQEKLPEYANTAYVISKKAFALFLKNWDWSRPIRSIGIKVCDLITDDYRQISMLEADGGRMEKLERCVDKIRQRYGHFSIRRAIVQNSDLIQVNPAEEHSPLGYCK